MEPLKIIQRYYKVDSKIYQILTEHSRLVADKSLKLAKKASRFQPDLKFIEEAAMLHDIGILMTNAPKIGCYGKKPYVCHGYLGREILEKEGLPKHGLVCERHVGVGITKDEIIKENLPLPKRDMLPVFIEEKIICLADKFFSKSQKRLSNERSPEKIRAYVARFGKEKAERLEQWFRLFSDPDKH